MVKNKRRRMRRKVAEKKPVEETEVKSTSSSTKSIIWGVITAVIIFVVVMVVALNMKSSGDTGAVANAVKVDFYVMSQCPFGTQVEDAIAPTLEQLGDSVDFNLNYIVSENPDGTFRSLHGEPEVQGNIVQLCAIKYEPENYMKMIICMNKGAQNIPGNWEGCAAEAGLAVDKIRICYEGDEGKQLLSESAKRTAEAGAQASPTIYIDGQQYQGGRKSSDFMRAICGVIEESKPQPCADIPEPTKINLVILNDKRCEKCDVSNLKTQLKTLFPGVTYKELDYSDSEGKKLFEDLGLKALPAILFDKAIEQDESYANVKNYLDPVGDYLSLRIGASFDPTAEICDNNKDDTGNGKVDCEDPTCENNMICREEKEQHLQVFIMSDCPYGRKAIEALKPVVDNFGENIEYEVHYIANAAGDSFQSLHGQYEVDEDIIQLCVKEHSPDVWFDYMYCRSTKGVKGIDWKECANEVGVDVDKVQSCFDSDEGKDLLREDIKIAQGLGVGASPTWLANNRHKFSGIDSETVKSNFCQHNEDLEGCETELSSDTGGVPSGTC